MTAENETNIPKKDLPADTEKPFERKPYKPTPESLAKVVVEDWLVPAPPEFYTGGGFVFFGGHIARQADEERKKKRKKNGEK